MAFLTSCCPSLFSCLSGIPCVGRCCAYCDECCGASNQVGAEMVEPLVQPSSDVVQVATSTAVVSAPIITNGMSSPSSEELRPLKRRSVSFMLGPVGNDSLTHHPPGSPARSIIKKPDFRSPEELL